MHRGPATIHGDTAERRAQLPLAAEHGRAPDVADEPLGPAADAHDPGRARRSTVPVPDSSDDALCGRGRLRGAVPDTPPSAAADGAARPGPGVLPGDAPADTPPVPAALGKDPPQPDAWRGSTAPRATGLQRTRNNADVAVHKPEQPADGNHAECPAATAGNTKTEH